MSLQRTALQSGQLPTQLIWLVSSAIAREAQHRQAQRIGRVAVLRDRVDRHHERRPDQDRRRQEQAPDQEERSKLQADLPLDQEDDDPGQRDGQRRSPAPPRPWRRLCPGRASPCGSAWHRRSPPAGSIVPARATRPCRTGGAGRGKRSAFPSCGRRTCPDVIKSGVSRKPTATSAVPIVWSKIKGMNR